MKPLWKIKSLLSAMTLAGAVVILTAGASGPKPSPPDAVILNGVTEIFGDKRAFFQTPGLNPSSEQIFSLLAAANLGNAGTYAKSTSTTARPGAGAGSSTDNSGMSGEVVSNVDASGPHGGGTAANPNGKNPNASSPNSSSPIAGYDSSTSSSPASGDDSNSNPPDSHQYVWWYAEAQKIEKTRQETAQRVMAGEWPPEPLTPLTPPGTPAQLIGADSVFLKNGWE
jgi:hypothetical protein